MPFIVYPAQLLLHKTMPPDPGHLPPRRANINCKVQCEIDSKGCAFTGKLKAASAHPFYFQCN